MDPSKLVNGLSGRIREDFEAEQRLLSFQEWLALFHEAPYRLARSAPQYVLDMLDHFGASDVSSATGLTQRYSVFDQTFRDREGRVHGQEVVQQRVYRLLRTMADEGRSDKLILLHGPNGSGKSVLIEAIFRGLEEYSRRPEGALYRFHWVFPKSHTSDEALGFGVPSAPKDSEESYALLEGESLSARLICELKDHPLFLIPTADRARLLADTLEDHPDDAKHSFHWVLTGELCQKCKGIYEGLLTGYRGDWRRLLRHVQVERVFISQRFRTGAVTIHPVASVDAQIQQVTADTAVQNLPPVLQSLKILEPVGDLVDANCGVVEYGDFLKRPIELNKYLLNAVEKGTITLPGSLIHLNLVMMGTSNEKHLDAFKASPDFTSFKGRIELVPVPYLLEYRKETELYEDMLRAAVQNLHVAPHTYEFAALWAILTRLIRANSQDLEPEFGDLAAGLTPLEKALFYDHHELPERLDRSHGQKLLAGAAEIRRQYQDQVVYEGRFGASPREMRMVLTQASYDRDHGCLTPPLVLQRLRDLIRDKTVYDFLKIEPKHGYHDPAAFIEVVSARYTDLILADFRDSMDLVSDEEYDRRFDRYFLHVTAFTRRELVKNPQTGAPEPPNETIMHGVEDLVDTGDSVETYRQELVARIGAFAVDHPAEAVDLSKLFPDLLRAVKRDYFERAGPRLRTLLDHLLLHGTDDLKSLEKADREFAETTLDNLERKFGYCPHCARSAAGWLKHHLPDEPMVTQR